MAENVDLDLEIVDAAVACNLYALALASVAIALKNKRDAVAEREAVSNYAKKLRDALSRCGVDQEIPVDVGAEDDTLRFLQDQELLHRISNSLVRQYSRRQELIFILACLVSAAISGAAGGISKTSVESAKSQAIAVGGQLGVPESVMGKCFRDQRLTPLRSHLRNVNWSQVIEAKPGIWGFTIDLKKMFTIISRWFGRKEAS